MMLNNSTNTNQLQEEITSSENMTQSDSENTFPSSSESQQNFFIQWIDSLKKKHILPRKMTPSMIASVLGLFVVVAGAVAGYFLTQINQDVRQQASTDPYEICTSTGTTACIDGYVHVCNVPGSPYTKKSPEQTCGQSACQLEHGADYQDKVDACNDPDNEPSTEWNDTLCRCISNQTNCFTITDNCSTFSASNCAANGEPDNIESFPNSSSCQIALGATACTPQEEAVCAQAGGECDFRENLGRGVCVNVSVGNECEDTTNCGGNLICEDNRCVQPTGLGGQDPTPTQEPSLSPTTVSCYEYNVRNRSCIARGEYPSLESCQNAFDFSGDLDTCTDMMNGLIDLNQSGTGTNQTLRAATYGTAECAGGAQPGTCDLNRAAQPQICGKWNGRPGYWVNATQYEVDTICQTGNVEASPSPSSQALVSPSPSSITITINSGRQCNAGSTLIDSGKPGCLTGTSYLTCNDGSFTGTEVRCNSGERCQNNVGCVCTGESCTSAVNNQPSPSSIVSPSESPQTAQQSTTPENQITRTNEVTQEQITALADLGCGFFNVFGIDACEETVEVESFSTTISIPETGRDCSVPHGDFACLGSSNCAVCSDGAWVSDQDQRNCFNKGACGVNPQTQTVSSGSNRTLAGVIQSGVSKLVDNANEIVSNIFNRDEDANENQVGDTITSVDVEQSLPPEELVGPSGRVCYCKDDRGLNYACEDQTLCCDIVRYTAFTQNMHLICSPGNQYSTTGEQIDIDILENGSLAERLPADYVPPNLSSSGPVLLQPDVAAAVSSFTSAAAEQGYSVHVNSGYRSYEYQNNLYQDCESKGGYPNCLVAPPGYSQHQTGRAIDMYILVNGELRSIYPLIGLANSFGLVQTVPGDPPHFYMY